MTDKPVLEQELEAKVDEAVGLQETKPDVKKTLAETITDDRDLMKTGILHSLSNSFFLSYSYFFTLVILLLLFIFLVPTVELSSRNWQAVKAFQGFYYLLIFCPILFIVSLMLHLVVFDLRKVKVFRYWGQFSGIIVACVLFYLLFFPGNFI